MNFIRQAIQPIMRIGSLAVMLSAVSACGFHLAKPAAANAQWQNTQFMGQGALADDVLARLELQYLLVDRIEKLKDANAKRPLIELRRVRIGRRTLGLDTNGLANGYELSLSLEVVLSQPGQQIESRQLVSHRSLQVDSQNPLVGETQIEALHADIRYEMVERVLRVINRK